MKRVAFVKMAGAGNDFVIVDHRRPFLAKPQETAQAICHRKLGIGADGLLLIERPKGVLSEREGKSPRADLKMRIFNPDGSEAQMCGNGIRCFAYYAYKQKLAPRIMEIETLAGVMTAKVMQSIVQVTLQRPRAERLRIPLTVEGRRYQAHFIDAGVPHAVIFVDDVDRVDVDTVGRMIRNHQKFQPRGTNVNFVELAGKRAIAVRTYERGVEGETLACGTGAVASAVMAHRGRGLSSPIAVKTRGGETLRISFDDRNGLIDNVRLEGAIRVICEGQWLGG